MANTIEITDSVREWVSNYEMLKSFRSHNVPGRKALQDEAIEIFRTLEFPTSRNEEWKYTSLQPLLKRDYGTAFVPPRSVPLSTEVSEWWSGFRNPVVLILNNGHFDDSLSKGHDDLLISRIGSGKSTLIEECYGRIAPLGDHATLALNTAVAENGLAIEIPRDTALEDPIFIVHLNQTQDGNTMAFGRTFIYAHENSQAKVVELWINEGGNYSFENSVTEIVVRSNANLHHYSLQNDSDRSSLINFMHADQYDHSVFTSAVITTKGEIIRNNNEIRHKGEHVESNLYGLYIQNGQQHVDNHTLVDHANPNCYSNELYKGVLDGSSVAVFNGKVMVRPNAQKTNAFQSNKTLLLSENATINTKPQLEIFADDVKCSHGATTGRLDMEALFYLRSRGLSEFRARALLTFAFAAEVLERIELEPIRKKLETLISSRLF